MFRIGRRTITKRLSPRRPAVRLQFEPLEERCLLSLATGAYEANNFVSDEAGFALIQDANLVNAWGIGLSPSGGAFWISDNGAGVTTLYTGDVNGSLFEQNQLVVTIPGGKPTGQVFNGNPADFIVTDGTNSGSAIFIFVSETGQIAGWNPNVPPPGPSTTAQTAVTVPGAIFKGATIANNGVDNFLYVTDFHNAEVLVFDKNFAPATLSGSFTDPNIPAGFAPFNIQNLAGKLYVTYAQQDADQEDDVAGPGLGFVDVFDANGNLLRRLASRGALNAPWGLALAPSDFGTFSNDVLVGNFGDGRISAFDPVTGAFRGQLHDDAGTSIEIEGLWALTFGNGVSAGDSNALYFTAGPEEEEHGLFGSLRAVNVNIVAVGAGVGSEPRVKVYDADTGALKFSFLAYRSTFDGGVRVAVGDVNGDGIPDIITAPGAGGHSQVRVFDGLTGSRLSAPVGSFFAYGAGFRGGVFVATGDVNGDGFSDIVTSPDTGKPLIKVFSGKNRSSLGSFVSDSAATVGGASVAVGDVNGDGKADIITGAGTGNAPQVTVFNGVDRSVLASFPAAEIGFTGGIFVAAGDVNGDGKDDIVTAPVGGAAPQVKVFSGADQSLLRSFLAANASFTDGIRVGTTDANGDGKADIITGIGPDGGSRVALWDGVTLELLDSFFALDPYFEGGLFVAGSR